MSDQKNTTDTPNIDDYLLNINIEDNNAPSDNKMEQGLDLDFLNQLGVETDTQKSAPNTPADEFSLDSLSSPTQDVQTPKGDDNLDFLNQTNTQDNTPSLTDIAGVATIGAGVGAVTNAVADTAKDTAKKGKGFFSGRFGKKQKPAPAQSTDKKDSFTETLLANKNTKKGLFSRLNKKEQPTPTDATSAPTATLTKAKQDKKSPFGGFGKKTATAPKTKAPKTPKATSPDTKKKNQLLIGALVCLALLALVAYLFLNNTSLINTPAPTPTPVATPAPAPAPAPANENILPNTTPTINPDEILNAEIPSDPALVKEEIDRLNDTGARLDEQGKIIEEQLTIMEDLTTAKAEQIALLEQQIAELEKQKANVATPTPSEQPAPTPAPQQ
ncbi:MAG: hypothetical protein Q3971_07300 [Moraxella sp.]|nr:hypothetical protein [Moraxella sp.]